MNEVDRDLIVEKKSTSMTSCETSSGLTSSLSKVGQYVDQARVVTANRSFVLLMIFLLDRCQKTSKSCVLGSYWLLAKIYLAQPIPDKLAGIGCQTFLYFPPTPIWPQLWILHGLLLDNLLSYSQIKFSSIDPPAKTKKLFLFYFNRCRKVIIYTF